MTRVFLRARRAAAVGPFMAGNAHLAAAADAPHVDVVGEPAAAALLSRPLFQREGEPLALILDIFQTHDVSAANGIAACRLRRLLGRASQCGGGTLFGRIAA
jgi:hypothetical protein